MRIISKQKDFYDYGSIYGVDTTVVYDRKPLVLKEESNPVVNFFAKFRNKEFSFHSVNHKYRHSESDYGEFYVFIGGIFYNFYFFREAGETKIFNDIKHFQECVKHVLIKSKYNYFRDDAILFDQDTGPLGSDIFRERFLEFGYPVVVCGVEPQTKYNVSADHFNFSNIESFGFMKKFICVDVPFLDIIGLGSMLDANKCFNDISNFLISKKEPAMVTVSDSEKITKHGFDKKISFRGKQK